MTQENNHIMQSYTDVLTVTEETPAHEYRGISPITVDNLNDTISIEPAAITKLAAGSNVQIDETTDEQGHTKYTISASNSGTIYQAGEGIDISEDIISVDTESIATQTYVSDAISASKFYFTPYDFGAYGDGVHDDSSAFIELFEHKNIYLPDGTYNISEQIEVLSGTKIVGDENAIICAVGDGVKFYSNDISDFSIENVKLTSPSQKASNVNTNYIFLFEKCKNVTISNCEIFDTYNGIRTYESDNIVIKNNKIHDNAWWGIMVGYSTSNVKNVIWDGNIAHDNGADGLKMTGFLEHVIVINNISYNNVQDGFDYAGHGCKDVLISNNEFYENQDCGITFKALYRCDYPTTATEFYWEDVRIVNNNCSYNLYGINLQNYYDDYKRSNVLIDSNLIRGRYYDADSTWLTSYGIKLGCAAFTEKDSIIISNNELYNVTTVGIRLIDTRNVTIRNNKIRDYSGHLLTAIRVDWIAGQLGDKNLATLTVPFKFDNLHFIDNEIKLTRSNAQCLTEQNTAEMIDGGFTSNNWVITGNKCDWNNTDSYAIWLVANSGIQIDNEYTGDTFITKPNVRGTLNFLYKSSSPLVSKCLGWICTVQGDHSNAKFEEYGALSYNVSTFDLPNLQVAFPKLEGQSNDTNLGSVNLTTGINIPAGKKCLITANIKCNISYEVKVANTTNNSAWGIALKLYNDSLGYDAYNYTIGEGYFADKYNLDTVFPQVGDRQNTNIIGVQDFLIDNTQGTNAIYLDRLTIRNIGTVLDTDNSHFTRLNIYNGNSYITAKII